MKHLIVFVVIVSMLGVASPVFAGGDAEKGSLPNGWTCAMANYRFQIFKDCRQAETSVPTVQVSFQPIAAVPVARRCNEKPGGWSDLEYYEENTWFFRTWGRLMTVSEREAWRCGWPI